MGLSMSMRLVVLTAAFAAALCGDVDAGSVSAQKVAMQDASLRTAPTEATPAQKMPMPTVPALKAPVQPAVKAPVQTVPVQNASVQKPLVQKVAVQGISVPMDNVRLVTFKTPVATVYIGNPSIAQLTVIDARHVFVMGKRFGATNLIALSPDKRLIESDPVTVTSRQAAAVTIFRGEDTYNYVCTDFHCETRPVPGDPKTWYDNTEGAAGEHEDAGNKGAGTGGGSAAQVH